MKPSRTHSHHLLKFLLYSLAVSFVLLFASHQEVLAASTITGVDPAPNSIGAPVSTRISASFNEPLNQATVNNCGFSLSRVLKVTNVSANSDHIVATSSEGTVIGWGGNPSGVTNSPSGISGVVSVVTGGSHNLALTSDGSVVSWGDNTYGQSLVPAGLAGVVAVSAGDNHSVALKVDGSVVSWGNNAYGQSTVPAGLSGVISVAAGAKHTVVVKGDGTVIAWGYNYYNQASVPTGLSNVIKIAAGVNNSAALRSDGTVVVWGANYTGQNQVPAGLSGVTDIAVGGGHVVALKSDGTVVAWGNNNYGQATVPAGLTGVIGIAASSVTTVVLKSDGSIVAFGDNASSQNNIFGNPGCVLAVSAGANHTVALKSDGSVIAWGSNLYRQTEVPAGLNSVSAIAAGEGHMAALKTDGTVVSWGRSSTTSLNVPVGLAGVTAIAAGGIHTMALKSDGTVAAWGTNIYGETTVPTGLNGVIAVSAGFYHSVALKSNGTLVAWGNNSYGQVSIPAGLNGVTFIASGMYHNIAVKADGTVTSWGLNDNGQTAVPTGLSGVVQVAGGYRHSLALKADGTVVAWGDNSFGQISVPTALSGVVAVSAGDNHSLALKSDGTVIAWGYGRYGQTTVPRSPYEIQLNALVNLESDGLTTSLTPLQSLPFGAEFRALLNGTFTNFSGEKASALAWNFRTADNYLVVTSVSGGTGGTLNCNSANPLPGQDVICTLTPSTGFLIAALIDNKVDALGAVNQGKYILSAVAGDHILQATFSPISLPLSISVTGNGSVRSSPEPDIACNTGLCGVSYPLGTLVSLTATPETGSYFAGWGGDCSGSVVCSLDMAVAHTVNANFLLNSYSITATAGANGSITGPAMANYGDSAAYTITPAVGHHVADVLVDGFSVGAVTSYSFSNVVANHTVSASFAIDTFTVTISADANGSISGPAIVNYGDMPTYAITPSIGYHIVDVTVNGTSSGAVTSYSFLSGITANTNIAAVFAIDTFPVTTNAGTNGSISGPAIVNYGASAAYTITPVIGYNVADVLVDGISVGAVTNFNFSNVTANHTISASFVINSYSINATAGSNGSISGPATVNFGSNAAFTITPAIGYHVADVLVDGASVGAVTSYSFSNVTANHTISASFAINSYSISASAGANGSIAGPAIVNYGGSAGYTITPTTGYHVVDVLMDGVSVGAVTSYNFTNVTANHTISASFAINSYSISATAGANGGITGPATVNYGGSAAFTFTPSTGYRVADVQVDGVSMGSVTSYNFSNVTANHIISATFVALVDLVATTVTGPSSATRGKSISVSSSVKNQGGGNVGSFTVAFYLSKDTTVISSDTLLGTKTVTSLTAGSTTTVSGSFTVPSGMATGKYYVGVIVDSGFAIAESNEANNSKAAGSMTTVR